MLDIKYIRNNKDEVIKKLQTRQVAPKVIEEILELDNQRRQAIQEAEKIKAEKNKFNKEIFKLKKDERTKKIQELTKLTHQEEELAERLITIEETLTQLLNDLPNIPEPDVPIGKDETENKIINTVNKPKKFDFKPKDHLELGLLLDLIDIDTAAKVSGARFNYLKNEAVWLQFALINYALSILTDKNKLQNIINKYKVGISNNPFIPIIPPVLVKEETLDKMARLEPKEERYLISKDNLFLVGSAEHTLGPMHVNQILFAKDLPVRYVGYSTSFRREAGSYGKDTRGIFRVHQFDKLEMQSFSLPEQSRAEQDFFIAIQKFLMEELEIPFQVKQMCTGDMTAPDARQIDIEAWMPSQNTYRETHTSDLTTDYQARRLNIRFKKKSGDKGIVHMNDATVFAIGRTLIAILENYQQADGSVKIPAVLQVYMNGIKEIKNKQ